MLHKVTKPSFTFLSVLCCSISRFIGETWVVKKERGLALQRAEMRMIRWMCVTKVTDRCTRRELREIYKYSGAAL